MHHEAARCSEVMNNLECVQLVRHVLGGSEIRDEIVFRLDVGRHAVVVQIERNAAGTAIDVDGRVIEPQPLPKRAGGRRCLVKMLKIPMDDPRWSDPSLRKREWFSGLEQLGQLFLPVGGLKEARRQLLRADLDDRGLPWKQPASLQANQQLDRV